LWRKAYKFQTTLTNVDGNVLIEPNNTSGSIDNLISAINLDLLASIKGVKYAEATTINPETTLTASAGAGDTMDISLAILSSVDTTTTTTAIWTNTETVLGHVDIVGDTIVQDNLLIRNNIFPSQISTLTFTAVPSDDQIVTIGNKVYKFQTTLLNSNGNVLIGGTTNDSIKNLISAINLTDGAGIKYASSTTVHPEHSLIANRIGSTMEISLAILSSVDTSTTTTATWIGEETVLGHVDIVGDTVVQGNIFIRNNIFPDQVSTLTFTQLPGQVQTVTIGTKVYTFQTQFPPTNPDHILIEPNNITGTIDNIVDAINLNPATRGTKYSTLTTVHPNSSLIANRIGSTMEISLAILSSVDTITTTTATWTNTETVLDNVDIVGNTKITGNIDFTGIITGNGSGLTKVKNISDTDGDTRIEVEKNPDDDTVRIIVKGFEAMTFIDAPATNRGLLVGIGTSRPTKELDIRGDVSVGDELFIRNRIIPDESSTLSLTAIPSENETVTIGGKVYRFKPSVTGSNNVNGNVLIGDTAGDSLNNLIDAINLIPGSSGLNYAENTTINPESSLVALEKDGNLVASVISQTPVQVLETLTNGEWSSSTTIPGDVNIDGRTKIRGNTTILGEVTIDDNLIVQNSISATQVSTLTFTAVPSDNQTVTIGGKVYRFKISVSGNDDLDGNVKIGTGVSSSLNHLVDAINLNLVTRGDKYANLMRPNPEETLIATRGSGLTMDIKSIEELGTTTTIGSAAWIGTTTSIGDVNIGGNGININGSISVNVNSVSLNYTAKPDDHIILVDALSGNITISLPKVSAASGRIYTIKKIDTSSNKVIIDANLIEVIDDILTKEIIETNQSITVVSDGFKWWII